MPQPGPSSFDVYGSASHAQRVRDDFLRQHGVGSRRKAVFKSADGLFLLESVPPEPFIHRTLDFPDRCGRRTRAYECIGHQYFAGEDVMMYHEMTPVAPAYKCSWVTSEAGVKPTWCGKRASHKCEGADAYFCAAHATDYEDCFGELSTKAIQ